MLAELRRDFFAARDFLRQLDEIKPQWIFDARMLLGARCRAEIGEVAEALAAVRTELPKLRSFPNEQFLFEPLANSALVMISAGRYREAESYARELWQILDGVHRESVDPDRAEALELLGSALSGQKRYKEAAPLFQRSEEAYRQSGPGFQIAARHVAELIGNISSVSDRH